VRIPILGINIPKRFEVSPEELEQMCEVAKGRLDASPSILRVLYLESPTTPEALRDIMRDFLDGKISKNETIQKLNKFSPKGDVQ